MKSSKNQPSKKYIPKRIFALSHLKCNVYNFRHMFRCFDVLQNAASFVYLAVLSDCMLKVVFTLTLKIKYEWFTIEI